MSVPRRYSCCGSLLLFVLVVHVIVFVVSFLLGKLKDYLFRKELSFGLSNMWFLELLSIYVYTPPPFSFEGRTITGPDFVR